MTCWERKSTFIISRVFAFFIGLVRMIIIVRLLTLSDYATIGVVEGIRLTIGTIFGLSLPDALAREGVLEADDRGFSALVASTYAVTLVIALIAVGVLLTVVALAPWIYEDQRIGSLLLICIPILFLDRLWSVTLAVLRAQLLFKPFVLAGLAQSVIGFGLTITFVYEYGVKGYFHSQWLVFLVLLALTGKLWTRHFKLTTLDALRSQWRQAVRKLWGVSVFLYVFKGSGQLWRRLPIIMGGSFVDPTTLGAVTVALNLAAKVQVINQALWPLVVPRLTSAFAGGSKVFKRIAMEECAHLSLINTAVFLIFAFCWSLGGHLIIGYERWVQIGELFYLSLGVEALAAVVYVSNMCVLVPAKALVAMMIPTFMIRISVVLVMVVLVQLGINSRCLIPYALLGTGFLLSLFYFERVSRTIREVF